MVNIFSHYAKETSSGTVLYRYLAILIALWTLIIGASLWFGLENTYARAEENTNKQARTGTAKDEPSIHWLAQLGVFY